MAASRLWGIVLAGGDGTRLASLTRRLYGVDLPKQFAALAGPRSLLQETVARVERLVPATRIAVVVPALHETLARQQLRGWPGVHVIPQPANRGTGPGLLLPLGRVLEQDPAARVVVAPSDHYVAEPVRFLDGVVMACHAGDRAQAALVGVPATHASTAFGWIVPGEAAGGARRVDGFVEKPTAFEAEALYAHGALWNTFVVAARARVLWELAARHLPSQAALLAPAGASTPADRWPVAYARMLPADFSRHVLQHAEDLSVVTVTGSGWADWGVPDNVFASLRGRPELDALLDRLNGSPRRLAPAPARA